MFAWQMERYCDAVSYGEIALHNIDRAIELGAFLGDDDGTPKDSKTRRCHVLGDLAFCCADSFHRRHSQSDTNKAIKHAQLLESSWNAFGHVPPTNLVGNYLFVGHG